MAQLGLVIRPDGTVPIDPGHPHRHTIVGYLVNTGHEIEHLEGGSVRILSGPHKPDAPSV